MACSCIADVDAKLADHNARLGVAFSFSHKGVPGQAWPHLVVEKIDAKKRGRLPVMVPTYCPFCGEPYEPQPALPAAPPPPPPPRDRC